VAGGSFYGGTAYSKAQTQTQFPGPGGAVPGANGQPGRAGAAQGGAVTGQIEQIGDGALVIKDANGTQTQVKVTDTTLIEKNAQAKLADLSQGETVVISGSQASDGTITARSVQVGAAGRMGFGGPAPAATPGS
jgi:hypothetical protein